MVLWVRKGGSTSLIIRKHQQRWGTRWSNHCKIKECMFEHLLFPPIGLLLQAAHSVLYMAQETNHQSRNSSCSTHGISRNRLHTHTSIINIIKQPYPTTSIRWAALAPLWSIPWGVEAQWQIIGALLQLRAMPRFGEAITHGRWSEMLDPSLLWDISWTWSWGFRRLELRMYCSFKMPGLEKSVWFFGRYFLGVSKFSEHAVWWMTMTYHDSHAHRRV